MPRVVARELRNYDNHNICCTLRETDYNDCDSLHRYSTYVTRHTAYRHGLRHTVLFAGVVLNCQNCIKIHAFTLHVTSF